MSGSEQEPVCYEVDVEKVAWLQEAVDDLEQTVITMQGTWKEELAQRKLVIDDHDNEMITLYRKLTEELLSIRRDVANEFGNLRKHVELQGDKVDVLTGLVNGFARDFVRPNEVVEQQTHKPTRSNDSESDVSGVKAGIESPFETQGVDVTVTGKISADENSEIAAFELNPSSDAVALTNCSKQDRVKVDESTTNELEASNKSIGMKNEDIGQVYKQIASQQLEISNLTSVIATRDVEVSRLKDQLNMAEKKLGERLEVMKQMGKVTSSVEQLTHLMADRKVNEESYMEDVRAVVESIQATVSSWTTVLDRIKHVSISTGSTSEESGVMNTELPDYLTRLQQLYPRMTEKLTALSVAAELFQNDVLSLAELQKVQNPGSTPVEAAEYLLNRLLDMRSKDCYDCFLSALKATNQEHIFLWLTYDDYNIDSRHTDLIRRNYSFLLHHLDPKDSGLNALLYKENVIDLREREFLDVDDGAVRQAERLLSVLSRKSMDQFERFLAALDNSEHVFVSNELRRQKFVESSAALATNAVTHDDLGSQSVLVADVVVASEGPEIVAGNSGGYEDSSPSSLTSAIAGGCVGDLTVHGNELYLVRLWPAGRIEVYNATNYTFQRNIDVDQLYANLISTVYVNGLTSCDTNNCLYVSVKHDYDHCSSWLDSFEYKYSILRVELIGNNESVKWKAADEPRGLSVNNEHNVMVACCGTPTKLIEYTTRGQLVREIRLPDDVKFLKHALQLNGYRYLVSVCADLEHRVCVVDANGRVLLSYGNEFGSKTGQLKEPQHLAVDRNGFIFVADMENNRIVVLDSTLKWSRDLQIDGGRRVNKPHSLCLDDQRNQLFIGEWNGSNSHVVVVTM